MGIFFVLAEAIAIVFMYAVWISSLSIVIEAIGQSMALKDEGMLFKVVA